MPIKKYFVLLTLIFSKGFAQIPNPGFEQISIVSGICGIGSTTYTVPTGYASGSSTLAVQTGSAHTGNYCGLVNYNNLGIADTLQTFDCNSMTPTFGYTGSIPSAVNFWTHAPGFLTTDSLFFLFQFFDNNYLLLTQGSGGIKATDYLTWTQVTTPLITVTTGTPTYGALKFYGKANGAFWLVDDVSLIATGIQNYSGDNFNIYFNSFSNQLSIKSSTDENISVSIYDMLGKKILETPILQVVNNVVLNINTQEIMPGTYLVKMTDKTGIISTKRILIN